MNHPRWRGHLADSRIHYQVKYGSLSSSLLAWKTIWNLHMLVDFSRQWACPRYLGKNDQIPNPRSYGQQWKQILGKHSVFIVVSWNVQQRAGIYSQHINESCCSES